MPRENVKRGRRGDKNRKSEFAAQDSPSKKRKTSEGHEQDDNMHLTVHGDEGSDFIGFDVKNHANETPFYGLLTQEEQDYYGNVNSKLELNDFESPEDLSNFIEAVYQESNGKELKVASSQSCSRYLEKVIQLSNTDQLKTLFGKFESNFLHLVQHRFASHCCEALFLAAAPQVHVVIAQENSAKVEESTIEERFLQVVKELKPDLGYLITERFASHVIRVLLIVLSGEPLNNASNSSVLASRKKEKVEILAARHQNSNLERREVPDSFKAALSEMIQCAISTLDTTYLRALATHPTGNPVLQLLLRLELGQLGKSKVKNENTALHKLLPDEGLEEGGESANFVQSLLYDPTGSRLIETIVEYAPGKVFKKIYRNLLRNRMGPLARNDIASYVAIKVLERLGREDLEGARDQILSEIPGLVERSRFGPITVLVERCNVRQVDMKSLALTVKSACGEASSRIFILLKLDSTAGKDKTSKEGQDREEFGVDVARKMYLHGSLLAQALLRAPVVCDIIQEALLATSPAVLFSLAIDPTGSRVIQTSLTAPTSDVPFRRKLVPLFYGRMAELAVDHAGSHLADALWDATNGAHFMKERLAKELQENEAVVRESKYGRTVWKNWSMDIYQRRPQEWQVQAKGISFDRQPEQKLLKKSAIELARGRFTEQKNKFQQKRVAELAREKFAPDRKAKEFQ